MTQTMASTDTRNKAWAEDTSKFGYRMLQKMGWSKGKGLGANEDGTKERIRIKRHASNTGVGGTSKTDAWDKPAAVAEGLGDVLARLAPVHCNEVETKAEKVVKKGRGYYERRSAGKNVSAYSESDLREILGGAGVKQSFNYGKGDDKRDEKFRAEESEAASENAAEEKAKSEKAERKRLRREKRERKESKKLAVRAGIHKTKKHKKDKNGRRR